MKNHTLIIFSCLAFSSVILIALIARTQRSKESIATSPVEHISPIPEPIPAPVQTIDDYTVQKGDVLGSILPKYGVSTHKVLNAAKNIFDLSKIRVGKTFSFIKKPSDALEYTEIRYPLDIDNTLILQRKGEEWSAKKKTAVYEKKRETKTFIIEHSFWQSASTVGLKDSDISSLVQLFEYDIDFNTEIRTKGSVRLVLNGLYQKNTFVRYGAPDIVEFTNNGETFLAIRYTTTDGNTLYYDEKGVSRKGAFLRSPLAYSRVTSSFNPKRFHPILKKKRPHNGTDFGAPKGTTIRAASNGVVTYAASNGGHGKFVKIKHNKGYETSYSHLSKILVRKGARVKQGTTIGKVGSTGRSTGPHLHYQMWKNGRFVDAMKEKLPKTQSISASEKKVFIAHKKKLKEELQRSQ
jgi:murein DD-endopeptidase MepM/ murein hydrolase activator NlpD